MKFRCVAVRFCGRVGGTLDGRFDRRDSRNRGIQIHAQIEQRIGVGAIALLWIRLLFDLAALPFCSTLGRDPLLHDGRRPQF
jgi:hypothetical protein